MKPVFLIFSVLIALLTSGCEPEDNALVVSAHQGHSLELIDHTTVQSVGARNHQAVLVFDGKTVSDQNVGFPLLPDHYPDWVVRTYETDSVPSNPPLWTVYVSPATFSRADFDQLVTCFENQRTAFDSALTAFPNPNFGKPSRIERIVYGEAPKPRVFRPASRRYETVAGDETEETITIRPNGDWFFQLASDTNGMHSVTNAAHGKLVVNGGQLAMEKPFIVDNPSVRVRPAVSDLSDFDYLRSFADSTGKPLLNTIKYAF